MASKATVQAPQISPAFTLQVFALPEASCLSPSSTSPIGAQGPQWQQTQAPVALQVQDASPEPSATAVCTPGASLAIFTQTGCWSDAHH